MKFSVWRLLVVVPAIASIALLSPACAEAPTVPSRLDYLDYLVFASLADSSRLPTLTAYRAPESVRVGRPRD